jgi:cytochrome c-type biogenesis protein CcmH
MIAAAVAAVAPNAAVCARADAPPSDATQFQIESDLTCQCGCGLTVHSCNHLSCSSGIPLKQEIATQLSGGKSREGILSYFQTKYGEKILAAPTTRGFNIAAWTVPFVAIGLGGAGIAIALSRWRRTSRRRVEPHAATAAATPMDAERRARLDAALAEYERRS